jgi:hypothetical protein
MIICDISQSSNILPSTSVGDDDNEMKDINLEPVIIIDTTNNTAYDFETFDKRQKSLFYKIFCCFAN